MPPPVRRREPITPYIAPRRTTPDGASRGTSTEVARGATPDAAARPEVTGGRDAYAERAADTGVAARIRPELSAGTIPVGRLRTVGAPPLDALPGRTSRVPPDLSPGRATSPDSSVGLGRTARPPRPHELPTGPTVSRPDPFASTPEAPRGRGAFTGPILERGQLDEATEAQLVASHGGTGVLAAYRGFDPDRPPVVLVHGVDGAPEDLADVADELDRRGMQVLFFAYDDRGTRTHASGDQLASELEGLRDLYEEGQSIDIVAHSMGGIVTRAALNTLQQPGWMSGDAATDANPRAGFDSVRVRALDTAWTGYPHEPAAVTGLVRGIMDSNGMAGLVDMRANSEMFEHLFSPQLEGVDLQTTAAYNIPSPDAHRSVQDLSVEQAQQLVAWLRGGDAPTDLAARNLAGAWAQDSRFPELQSATRGAASIASPAELAALAERVMPSEVGTHTSILRDDPIRPSLVDRLADDLAP